MVPDEDTVSASGDDDADADFEAMMRSLGMTEEDFEAELGIDLEENLDDLTDDSGRGLDDDDLGNPYRDDDN